MHLLNIVFWCLQAHALESGLQYEFISQLHTLWPHDFRSGLTSLSCCFLVCKVEEGILFT
jgi:hypothetical protein